MYEYSAVNDDVLMNKSTWYLMHRQRINIIDCKLCYQCIRFTRGKFGIRNGGHFTDPVPLYIASLHAGGLVAPH